MIKIYLKLFTLSIVFLACEKEEENLISFSTSTVIRCQEDCDEWERCTNVSNDLFEFDWKCRPKLNLYSDHGNWNGQLNVL
ncbi:MAG: hypothetical protein CMD03_03435, partial [Flavobacteriales bacterium]|nr:hypothetical protein [Flavobacteriales bacterium]